MNIMTSRAIREQLGIVDKVQVADDGWADGPYISYDIQEAKSPYNPTDYWRYTVELKYQIRNVVEGGIHADPRVYDAVMDKSATAISRQLYGGIGEAIRIIAHRINTGELGRNAATTRLKDLADQLI